MKYFFQCLCFLVLGLKCLVNGSFQIPLDVITESSVEEAISKWKRYEDGFKVMFADIAEQLTSVLIKHSSEVNITEECSTALMELFTGFKKGKMWAFEMFDATGKPGGGFFTGTATSFGDYDQCLGITIPVKEGPPAKGQYCFVDFQPPLPPKPEMLLHEEVFTPFKNVSTDLEFFSWFYNNSWAFYSGSIRIAVCVPSLCTKDDIQEIATSVTPSETFHVQVISCEIKVKKSPDNTQIAIIVILSLIIALVVLATVIDTTLPGQMLTGIFKKITSAMSIQQNFIKLMDTSKTESSRLSCFHGMRFISVCWIVMGHGYLLVDYHQIKSSMANWAITKGFFMQILNNASVGVETFLFMTGTLMSYSVIKSSDEKGFRPIYMVILVVRRIFRLLPSILLAIGIAVLMPLCGDGPMWNDAVGGFANNCRKNWWPILLFGNNFVPFKDQCLLQVWYVSVDIQLLTVAVAYFFIYHVNTSVAKIVNVLVIILSIISSSLVTYIKGYPATSLTTIVDQAYITDMWNYTYYLPHTHIASYCIGLALGTFLSKTSSLKIPKKIQVVGWCLAILFCIASVFGTYEWNLGRYPTTAESFIYSGLQRPIWSLGLAWIVLVCSTGNGGAVNSSLSWKGYQLLNKLTYLVYLCHLFPYFYFTGEMRGSHDCSHTYGLYIGLGSLVLSFFLAFVLKLLFEAPITELEKLCWDKKQHRKKESSSHQNQIIHTFGDNCNENERLNDKTDTGI